MLTNPKILLKGLAVCVVLGLAPGCGKKEAPPPPPTEGTNAAAVAPTPQAEEDAMIFTRSLEYAKGLVARKQYDRARQAIQTLESKTLTPAQRKAVDEVKAQIPKS